VLSRGVRDQCFEDGWQLIARHILEHLDAGSCAWPRASTNVHVNRFDHLAVDANILAHEADVRGGVIAAP
jgi:hypothetical protein